MDNFLLLSDTIKESWQRIGKPQRVLIAYSGGADSSALLMALRRLNKLQDGIPELLAVHVNHHLRPTSTDDAEASRALCDRLHIPFICADVFPRSVSEDHARIARYEALYNLAREHACDVITLAHHLHDQTETMFMRLMRGTGDGLKGMAEYVPDTERTPLWRPLLNTHPDLLKQSLEEVSVSWQEDETNRDSRYLRNFIRLQVLPPLRERAPHLDTHMAQTACILQDESTFLRSLAEDFLSAYASMEPPCPFMDADAFSALHIALKRRIVKCLLDAFSLSDSVTFAHIDAGASISIGETVNLPMGFALYHAGKRIHLLLPSVQPLAIPSLEELPFVTGLSNGKTYQSMPKSVYAGTCLRHRRSGDYIQPFGMAGQKTLQDYLTDRKVDRPFRDHLPLLCQGSEVLWVIGVGASEKMRALPESHMNILLHYPGRLIMELHNHTTKEL